MKLSPKMIQAMEILQLPLLALQERIDAELISNPCLELREGGPDEPDEPAGQEESPEPADRDLVVGARDGQDDFRRLGELGRQVGEEYEWSERRPRSGGDDDRDPKMEAMANTPAPDQNLMEHLQQQWAFVEAPEPVKAAGRIIINQIDDDGYLRTPLEELARLPDEPTTLAALRQALPLVQRLDPPGVGGRDLRECLLIQLEAEQAAGRDVELQKRLVSEFLHEIELNHITQIARKTGHTAREINEAISALGRLDPRPGRLIGQRPVPYVVPDAVVWLGEDGQPVITMRDGDAPPIRVSRSYQKLAHDRQTDTQARDFIRKNLRSAQWLIEAIQQRRRTVRRVVERVFAAQKEFLERGPEALRPLPMTEVAAQVGVHVATVSRAVAGKYVQTPRGIFPLRMFFSGGKTTAEGEDMAWDAIKVKMREVIDAEDKSRPLNDDAIAAGLLQRGIKIARRTVAKYRDLLNIPPARQRRQY